MTSKIVLAIDPGSSKCGMAVVERSAQDEILMHWHKVVPADELEDAYDSAKRLYGFSLVIVGDGTRSRTIQERLRAHAPSMGLLVVDEKDTTMEARARYWEKHPRRGFRRLLPSSMQTPPVPFDDFVALILAERVLAE